MPKFLTKNSTSHFVNQRQIPAVLVINCMLPLIEHGDASAKQQTEVQKQLHLRKAELARDAYKTDTSCTEEDRQCIVFDLHKTLPTPHLNTNKFYYMRQLWTYNLAIHVTTSDHAYMHMWDET